MCNPSCVDFPTAPIIFKIQITFHPLWLIEATLNTDAKSKLPTFVQIQNIANIRPTSPILLTIIALIPHLLLSRPVNKKFISKYKHNPTPSYPTKS